MTVSSISSTMNTRCLTVSRMTSNAYDRLGVNEHLGFGKIVGTQEFEHGIYFILSGYEIFLAPQRPAFSIWISVHHTINSSRAIHASNISTHLIEVFKHQSGSDLYFLKIATDVGDPLSGLFREPFHRNSSVNFWNGIYKKTVVQLIS
ncbi:unnamed protein product [Linum trigynum]|uniref:Uncharacterized protein n=1 Tax=Linum trigynum TaxID=586398 RepID=A0AAV2FSU6_9ROSI